MVSGRRAASGGVLGPEHSRVGAPTEGGLELSSDQGFLQAQPTRLSGPDQGMKVKRQESRQDLFGAWHGSGRLVTCRGTDRRNE